MLQKRKDSRMTQAETQVKATKKTSRKAAAPKTETVAPKVETVEATTKTEAKKDYIMDMNAFNMPEAFKNMFDANNETFKKTVENAKTVASEATDQAETTTTTLYKTTEDLSTKAFDMFKANTESVFSQTRKLMGATTPAEAFEMTTAYAREAVETGISQAKDFSEAVQSSSQAVFEPVKEGFDKAVAAAAAK